MKKNYYHNPFGILMLAVVAILSNNNFSFGQSGPGGVGNAAGSIDQPKNVIWLDASRLNGNTGDEVTQWTDYSGNENHFGPSTGNESSSTAGSNAGFPTIQNAGFNYLNFKASDHERLVSHPFNDFPATNITTFMILRTGNSGDGILSYAVSGSDNEYLLYDAGNLSTYIDGGSYRPGTNFHDNNWTLLSNRWRSSDGDFLLTINNNTYSHTMKTGAYLQNGGSLALGGEQDAIDDGFQTNQDYNGDMAEVIIYDHYLNNAQRTIIENYLAAKYDINLLNDVYAGNESSNGNHKYEVIGIGYQGGVHSSAYNGGLALSTYDNSLDTDGEYIMAGHNGVTNSVVATSLGSGVDARWNRTWYIDRTGSANAEIAFDFGDGIAGEYPQNVTNYVLLRWNGSTYENVGIADANKYVLGDRVVFQVAEASLTSGIFTLGTLNETASPLEGGPNKIWYSYANKNWSDPDAWTLDGAANPLYVNPDADIPSSIDHVVISAGKTISIASLQNIHISQMEVLGRLDLRNSSGHDFQTISGNGTILMGGHAGEDNFPLGDVALFSDSLVGGTVEIYGSDISLNKPRIFNNLTIKLQSATNTATVLSDYIIQGNLRVKTGDLQFGDNSSTTGVNLDVNSNILVEGNGRITVGAAAARHQFNVYGDLTNNGILEFTNRTVADYNQEATDGIVDLNFLHDNKNQQLICNGPSRFYRIEIDKGANDTYALEISADDPSYFSLLGRANYGHSSVAQLDDLANNIGSRNMNALGLYRGTVIIGENVDIPVLSKGGNYNISAGARLWVQGGSVTKPSGTALVVYGIAQIGAGSLDAPINSGLTLRDNGTVQIDGGTLTANQIRTSVLGVGNVGGYVQTGGTINLVGGNVNSDYYVFNLTFPGNVFVMTGGVMNIRDVAGKGGVFINSDPENVNVSGGTVNLDISNNNHVVITSRAPFWNLNLSNTAGNSQYFLLSNGVDVSTSDIDLAAQPLVVKNDFTVGENTVFDHMGYNVTIGRNFTVQAGGDYVYDTDKQNTTILNGDEDAILALYNRTGAGSDVQMFYNMTINKPPGKEVVLASGKTGGNLKQGKNRLIRITGEAFKLLSGTFDQGYHRIAVATDTLVNYDVLTVYDPANATNAAAPNSNNDNIEFEKGDFVLLTADTSVFGNVQISSGNNIIELQSDVRVQYLDYQNGRVNLQSHRLIIDKLNFGLDSGAKFDFSGDGDTDDTGENAVNSPADMFITSGNDSDKGLSLYIDGNGTYTFPFGIGTDATTTSKGTSKYTPATVTVSNFSDDGYITINPVNEVLSLLNDPTNDALEYYWKVSYEGFSGVPDVSFSFIYDDVDVNGDESNYVPGRVNGDTYEREVLGTAAEVDSDANIIQVSTAAALVAGSYTTGTIDKFDGNVEVYYSRAQSNSTNGSISSMPQWTSPGTWSMESHTGAAATDYPQEGDVAIIGYGGSGSGGGGNRHHVAIRNSMGVMVAKVVMVRNPSAWPSRLYIEESVNADLGIVEGNGTLQYYVTESSAPDITADFGGFVSNYAAGSQFLYMGRSGTDITLPATPVVYPNIRIEGSGDRDFHFPVPITVKSELRVDNKATLSIESDIDVEGDLRLGSYLYGKIVFADDAAHQVSVRGNLRFTEHGNDEIRVQNTTPNGLEHKLVVYGNIEHSFGNIDLFSNNSGGNNVILELAGDSDATYNNATTNIPDFYRVVLNKGNNGMASFTFEDDFHLLGTTNGATKALELQHGLLILNHQDIDIDLTTGGDDFVIPATAGLQVSEGTVRASGNDTGILLDGALSVNENGHIYLDGAGNGNNYIQYSSSGNASIHISENGELIVGSQIRRGLTANVGVLNYHQTGGTIVVGKNAAPEASRGVFEITNATGNSFTYTGGSFNLIRQNTLSPTIAALFLNPPTSNVSNATITIGGVETPASQTIGIDANIALNHLEVVNSSGNNPAAQIQVHPLQLSGSLMINSGTSFDANGLDLTIYQDMTNHGTFGAHFNTTIFAGSSSQTIAGDQSITFYNLRKTRSGTLNLGQAIAVNKDLQLYDGTFSDNGFTTTLLGNLLHDAIHTSAGGEGIYFAGTTSQQLTRSGAGASTLGILTLNNAQGVVIPESNGYDFEIAESLRLESGVFNIGSSLLTLKQEATIEAVNPFGATNMVRTNSSYADKGLSKEFAANTTTDFTFPVGEIAYSPMTVVLSGAGYTSGNTPAMIRVVPASEIHPVINDGTDQTAPNDLSNVLQYYWAVESNGLNGFQGELKFHYDEVDMLAEDPAYDESHYIPASILYFDNASETINKFDPGLVDEAANEITFNFSNTSDHQFAGDYFAGVDQAIPDQIAIYHSSGVDAGYGDQSSWQETIPSGGPLGSIIIIEPGHTVTLNTDGVNVYRTEINGTLEIGSTIKHRLGVVSGDGTLKIDGPTLPSGQYDTFFSCTGGSLEYAGNTDYTVLTDIFALQNVVLSGTGERLMPVSDVNICNDLVVNGPTVSNSNNVDITVGNDLLVQQGTFESGIGTSHTVHGNLALTGGTFLGESGHTLSVNGDVAIAGNFTAGNNSAFNISGDLTYTSGTFLSSSSGAVISMVGTIQQIITGDFSGTRAFNRLETSNTEGLVLANNVDVKSELLLTNGIVNPQGMLKLNANATATPATGSAASFVNGILYKDMNNNSSFTFPVGKDKRWGHITIQDVYYSTASMLTWRAEYFDENVGDLVSSTEIASPAEVSHISGNEYWVISDDAGASPTGSVSAFVGLSWNASSDVSTTSADRAKLKVMVWNEANENWDHRGGQNHTGTDNSGSFLALSRQSFSEKIVTLGSGDETNPLPVELVDFAAKAQGNQVVLTWKTLSESHNELFEVQYSTDKNSWKVIDVVEGAGDSNDALSYQFVHENPASGTLYYRLKQVDYDGMFELSDIVSLQLDLAPAEWFANDMEVNAYPNPAAGGRATLRVVRGNPQGAFLVKMTDMVGKIYLQETFEGSELENGIALEKHLKKLPAGLYIIDVRYQKWSHQVKLIVE